MNATHAIWTVAKDTAEPIHLSQLDSTYKFLEVVNKEQGDLFAEIKYNIHSYVFISV